MKTHLIHHTTIYLGIALFIAGIALRMLIGRRRFNRRGIAGLQLFSSYWKWLIITRIESLLVFCAWILLLLGTVMTARGWYAYN
jgi:hypothetical protein